MFQISEVTLGHGVLGIAPLPGRSGHYEADMTSLLLWNPALVMSMTTSQEMARAGASGLGADLINAGVQWSHLPVPDLGAPPAETDALWKISASTAHRILAGGGRVLAHCFGGCGRSGMAILRLMVEAGEQPESALARLRNARFCAVETDDQFLWAAAGEAFGQ